MQNIDLTIQKVCTTCKTEEPLRSIGPHGGLTTVSEHTTIEMRIDPDEFLLCPTCGNPMRLHIKAQPYELVNHLDTPIAKALYEMERRQERKSHTIETRKTDDGQFEATVQELGVTVTGATEREAMREALLAIHLNMMEEYKKQKREAEKERSETNEH